MADSPLPLSCILDVRPAEVAAREPLPGSVNIPVEQLGERVYELPPKGRHLAIFGANSDEALAVLRDLGYRNFLDCASIKPLPGSADSGRSRLWHPSPIVELASTELPSGRALDLGCGSGRDSVYLAARGWKVRAIDRLFDAIDRARDLERRYLPPCAEPIEWEVGRIEAIEADTFDLVVAILALDSSRLRLAMNWVKPGGSLLVEAFTEGHRDLHGKPAANRAFSIEAVRQMTNWRPKILEERRQDDRVTLNAWLIKEPAS